MAHKKWIPKIYILIRWLSPSILTPIKQLEAKLGLGIAKLNRSQKNKNNIMQYSEKGCEDKRAETKWLNSMGPSWTRSSVCLILLERSRTMIFNPAHVVLVFNWQEIPLSTSRCLVRLGLARLGWVSHIRQDKISKILPSSEFSKILPSSVEVQEVQDS